MDNIKGSYIFCEEGELIWAKQKGSPWWPSKVTEVNSDATYNVFFYGTETKKRPGQVGLNIDAGSVIRFLGPEQGAILNKKKLKKSENNKMAKALTEIQQAQTGIPEEYKEELFIKPGQNIEYIWVSFYSHLNTLHPLRSAYTYDMLYDM